MNKVLIVTTIPWFVRNFEMNDVKILQEMGYEVHYACNFEAKGDINFEEYYSKFNIILHNIKFVRSPMSTKNFKAYKELKKLINQNDFALIHCHTPVGSILARLASKKARKLGTKVVYTAHGFHFFKGAHKKNWLVYYPIEKYCSKFTDVLITINTEDFERAKNKFKAKRTVLINGVGVNTKTEITVTSNDLKKELNIPENTLVLCSVGELSETKNHRTIIKGLKELDCNYVYLICGVGKLTEDLAKLVAEYKLEDKVKFLGYRKDIFDICNMSDIFLFPSYREGLPVALMEAMTAKKPCIVSDIRGNNQLIDDGKGGFRIADASDSHAYIEKIKFLIEHKNLCNEFGEYNYQKIKKFDIEIVEKQMKEIYNNILNK